MIVLDAGAVHRLSDPSRLIAALREAFAAPHEVPDRLHFDLPGNEGAELLVMPAWLGRNAIGAKIAAVMPGNAAIGHPTVSGAYLLLDGLTGEPMAVLDASALTQVRTAATSALAAALLAPRDARTLLLIGTGALVPHLIAAHASVRQFDRISIWGRDAAKTEALVEKLAARGLPIFALADLEHGVRRADIISSATSAETPLIQGAWTAHDAHIDLVGSYKPGMREADSALFAGARVVIDNHGALTTSGDLIAPICEEILLPSRIETLADLLRKGGAEARSGTTIFKSVGSGLADIAAAYHLVDRALLASSSPQNPDGPSIVPSRKT